MKTKIAPIRFLDFRTGNSLLASLVFLLCSLPGISQEFSGLKAEEIIKESGLVKMREESPLPEFIRFKRGQEPALENISQWLKEKFELKENFSLKLLDVQQDQLGFTHYRYQQYHGRIPVEMAKYMIHTKNGKVKSVNGNIYSELPDYQPTLTEESALQFALTEVNARSYKWELPDEEATLKREENDQTASYFPKGSLVLIKYERTDFRLAYKFDVYAHSPMSRNYVYVDAVTGDILFKNERIHTHDVEGTAETLYSGTKTITTDFTGRSYRLRETGRGNGIETYDLNNSEDFGTAVDFTDGDNYWNNVNLEMDNAATDAHWGTEVSYDYFLGEHSRNSVDGNGFKLKSYVHYGTNVQNAYWDGAHLYYGDGGSLIDPFTTLDIVGHEVTHGLTEFTAGLIYENESGALNESFSDIFATAIEFFGKPTEADWVIPSGLAYHIPFRNLSNPNLKNDPDTYLGNYWYTGQYDWGGVHTNSGVQNYWFYLLSNGGSGTNDNGDLYNITGIGMEKATQIAFRNLTVYLWDDAQYADARYYSISSAIDLFGITSPEVQATKDAWDAVGVYAPTYSSYCTSSASMSTWFWIDGISLGNINNSSGDDGGYGDYTSLTATITDGMPISLTPGYRFGPPVQGMFWNVWIDFNQDGDFEDNGELALYPLPVSGTLHGSINIPSGITQGITRMRIQAKGGYWASDPCESYVWGEVEDYTVFISSPKLAGDNVKEPVKELDHTLSTTLNPKAADYGQALALNTFPNPSKGLFQLEVLGGAEEGFTYKVLNLTGAIVSEGEGIYDAAARIDLSEQPKGIYFVRVFSGAQTVSRKVTLQ